MKKKVSLLCFIPLLGLAFILFYNGHLYCQTTIFDWQWAHAIGGTMDDKGSSIIHDQNDNIYIAGTVNGDSIDIEGSYYSTHGYNAAYISKYTQSGQLVWSSLFSSDDDAEASSICIDKTGDLFIAGYFTGTYLNVGDTQLVNNGVSTLFIAKYNVAGNYVWAKTIGGDSIIIPSSILYNADTSLYLAGKFTSHFTADTVSFVSKGGYDAFVLKYTTDGEIQWGRTIGGSGDETITDMVSDISSNIFAIGNFTTYNFSIGKKGYVNRGGSDVFMVKYGMFGNVTWSKQLGGDGDDLANDIAQDENANLYVGGSFSSSQFSIDTTSYILNNQGGNDGFIALFTKQGIPKAITAIASTQDETVKSICTLGIDLFVVAGSFNGNTLTMGSTTLNSQGLTDLFIAKYDSSLQVTAADAIGGIGNEDVDVLFNNSYKGVCLIGRYDSDYLSIGNLNLALNGGSDIFITSEESFSSNTNVSNNNANNYTQPKDGGLYGGYMNDLTYSSYNNRLFAGINTPASLFYSDDSAKTWQPAFSKDSLQYNQKTQGWGGECAHVHANTIGWVVALTSNPDRQFSSVVANYNGGDLANWKTFIDPTILRQYGFDANEVSALAISNYYIYVSLDNFLVRGNSKGFDPNSIKDIRTSISGLAPTSIIAGIAVANTYSGYPYYIAIDEDGIQNSSNKRLFKYDGVQFSEINFNGTNINGIKDVFTHLGQTTGDTLFIAGNDTSGNTINPYFIFRSYDGGNTWKDISYPKAQTNLTDVDYSPNWKSQLTLSNGLILIIPGKGISKDLGNTWDDISVHFSAAAIHPNNTSFVMAGRYKASCSTTGASGFYTLLANNLLSALTINKIARTADKKHFYLATASGIAYTSAYLDTTISSADKWISPNGQYPLLSDTITYGAVAIDANDSLHVIAGCPYGFYVSNTGPYGFSSLFTPLGFTNDYPQIHDIAIVSSSIALAVSGGGDASKTKMGNIWRSTDGGSKWDNVSPSGFSSGNTIAVGYGSNDTVIYVGSGLLDVDTGKIWKSVDLGATWTMVNIGPASVTGSGILGLPINDIAIIDGTVDSMYIAAGDATNCAFVSSADGGKTYNSLNLQGESAFTSVAIDKNGSDTVYVAVYNAIYTYIASTCEYHLIYEGLPNEKIPDLMHGSILVGTTTGFYTFHPTWDSSITAVHDIKNRIESQNAITIYPNPLTNNATLKIALQEKTNIKLNLYNLMGKKVMEKNYGNFEAGIYELPLNVEKISAGNYFINLNLNASSIHQKIMILK